MWEGRVAKADSSAGRGTRPAAPAELPPGQEVFLKKKKKKKTNPSRGAKCALWPEAVEKEVWAAVTFLTALNREQGPQQGARDE